MKAPSRIKSKISPLFGVEGIETTPDSKGDGMTYRFNKKQFAVIFLLLVVIAAWGCAGQKQQIRKESSQPTEPNWLKITPMRDDYQYVVGMAIGAATLEEGKKQAHSSAINEASAFIGVKIESETHYRVSSEAQSPLFDDRIDAKTKAYIASLEIVDQYFIKTIRTAGMLHEEKYDVYLLCRYPKTAAIEERQRQKEIARQNAEAALGLYMEAEKDESSGNFGDCIHKVREAIKYLGETIDKIELNSARFNTAQRLKAALSLKYNELASKSGTIYSNVVASLADHLHPQSTFKGAFSREISKYDLKLADREIDSRFEISGAIELNKGGKVFGQQCAHAQYDFKVKDTWSNRIIAGESSTVKGFAASFDAASREAVIEAGTAIGQKTARRINAYLKRPSR
jgi:hypothetical protein